MNRAKALVDSSSSNKNDRIVLLLDLDCFYAQCETVRLNLPQSLPLCLLQWNSALAVNYPARKYGIKRGDGFAEIQSKGKGKVFALHLPVIPMKQKLEKICDYTKQTEEENENENENENIDDSVLTMEEMYRQQFELSPEQQKEIFQREKNVVRNPKEGKANIERYRIASRRIFAVILETLTNLCGNNNFILEKASIDELFVDVTSFCYQTASMPSINSKTDSGTHHQLNDLKATKEKTVVVHDSLTYQDIDLQGTEIEDSALWQGCRVAHLIRKSVFETLGFTLSAGISVNKLLAKLGAGYGKPNGQAVIFPYAISKVMEETKIRKVRNLGGKLGKMVQALLLPEQDTVSAIAQNLSLPTLSKHLGSHETAMFVFNISRGICSEPVRHTQKVLNKSITSFKSFPLVESIDDLKPYIYLLGRDLIQRVIADRKCNERWPKNCNMQYTRVEKNGDKNAQKSIRIPFLTSDEYKHFGKDKFEHTFVDHILAVIEKKAQQCLPMCRIGLSATDFESQCLRGGIDSFFNKKNKEERNTTKNIDGSKEPSHSSNLDVSATAALKALDNKIGIKSITSISTIKADKEQKSVFPLQKQSITFDDFSSTHVHIKSKEDADQAYAQRLQASYDRENEILSSFKRSTLHQKTAFTNKRSLKSTSSISKKCKKLDNFFAKKK